jgi:DNA-binding IscR family transcriptional regulator
MKEVVDILEGQPYLIECINNKKICNRNNLCPSQEIWKNLNNVISNFLEGVTLKDLVDKYNKKYNKKALMFHI